MSASLSDRVFGLEKKTILKLCENIASVRSLTVYLLIKSNEWEQLLGLLVNPCDYDNAQQFADDYLVTSILQKNPRLPTNIDKREVAIKKFRASEAQCRDTNDRLTKLHNLEISLEPDVHSAIHHAREYIREVLGPLTRSKLSYAESKMAFGPGATTSLSGVVTQGTKYSSRVLDATPRVASIRSAGFPALWRETAKDICLRRSSKLTTVPKNAKTDRVICIEPDLNIFVQKGVGALLRKQLLYAGLDLSTQEVNQMYAQMAHEWDLCTLDLSSASDTISRETVWHLLPDTWAELLYFCRVDSTSIDGEEVQLEKWSSMGNGYTFELETLIFIGVVRGCLRAANISDPRTTAYGDDLIFPNSIRELVTRTLSFLGFSVNSEKSFGRGRFHESCGADFFDGVNVRPIFFRSDYHDYDSICYLYANNLRRWANRRNGGDSCDSRLLPSWMCCFSAVNHDKRFHIPEGVGDGGFVSDFDRAAPSLSRRKRDDGWCGYQFKVRVVPAEERRTSELGCLLAFLNGSISEFSLGVEPLRGRYGRPRQEEGYVLTWPNLGPWV